MLVGVAVEIAHDYVIGDVAGGGGGLVRLNVPVGDWI